MEDYEIEPEVHCPKCGHSPLHSRHCSNWDCDDGYIEDFLDDLEIPGTGYEVKCPECNGTGVERWCPNCGANLSGDKDVSRQFAKIAEEEEKYHRFQCQQQKTPDE
jgi:hypothetical protein